MTENEIHHGILSTSDTDKSTLWFHRNITDINDVYLNLQNTEENAARRRLLSRYMGNRISDLLGSETLHT